MSVYYGVHRSDDYLAHYGIKGMKWGIRKAIERGDKKAIDKHFRKASAKLNKLYQRADMTRAVNNAYAGRALARGFGTLAGIQGGLSGALLATEGKSALPLAAFFTGPMAAVAGASGIGYLKNKNRATMKGHERQVQKAKEFGNAMAEAFKDTDHGPYVSWQSKSFDDKYHLVDESNHKPKMTIKGSHLALDYNGPDKKRFMRMAGNPKNKLYISNDSKRILNDDPLMFVDSSKRLTKKRGEKNPPIERSSREQWAEYEYAREKYGEPSHNRRKKKRS